MVKFKLLWKQMTGHNTGIYIPIWLNSNYAFYVSDTVDKFIYIPIWLNSNRMPPSAWR